MAEIAFNLLEEPWVRVLTPECAVREVSLTDALLDAHRYIDLAGELPTQDVAMLRLLLAVLHTVFSRVDAAGVPAPLETEDDALDRWQELWELGQFPEKPIRAYLQSQRERFWLFHPERPFWQVPEAEIGTAYLAAKLNGELLESGNKLRLFSPVSGSSKSEMTFSQAARWLLYVNAFDDTSAKPKGKNLPSVGAGWLGKLGIIYAKGDTLFETLMLNLAFLKDGETLWGDSLPCWELDQPRAAERAQIAMPDNPAALLTFQSRRLILRCKDDRVTGYALLGGDFFERENAFSEQMTVWRQEGKKKDAPVVFRPKRHNSSIQFWREFPSVFSNTDAGHHPGVVQWIIQLQNYRLIERKKMVRFQITGVVYGDKDFFAIDAFSDSLSFHRLLLDEMGRRWQTDVNREIERCEKYAKAIGSLAKELSLAAGVDKTNVKKTWKPRPRNTFTSRSTRFSGNGCTKSTRSGMRSRARKAWSDGAGARGRSRCPWVRRW